MTPKFIQWPKKCIEKIRIGYNNYFGNIPPFEQFDQSVSLLKEVNDFISLYETFALSYVN